MCPKQPQNIYRVYRNLNNGSLSIKNKNTGRVAGYADEALYPKLVGSECYGNVVRMFMRILRELLLWEQTLNESGDVDYCRDNGYKCSYNPYNHKFFYDLTQFNEHGVYSDIHSARLCHVNSGGIIRVWS